MSPIKRTLPPNAQEMAAEGYHPYEDEARDMLERHGIEDWNVDQFQEILDMMDHNKSEEDIIRDVFGETLSDTETDDEEDGEADDSVDIELEDEPDDEDEDEDDEKEAAPVVKDKEKLFIQLNDEPRDQERPTVVHLLSTDLVQQVPTLSYVITRTPEATYFGQMRGPTMWLTRSAQNRFDPNAMESVHRIEKGEQQDPSFFRRSQYQCTEIIVEAVGTELSAPSTRPYAGARWKIASTDEISRYTNLPAAPAYPIGIIAGIHTRDSSVMPVRITEEVIRHHILTAGSTGSGKSNSHVQAILASQHEGFCTIVYDMKPDYSEIDQPNDELPAGAGAGVKGVKFWSLGVRPNANEKAISVAASELDLGLLAATIFFQPKEDQQMETGELLLMGFADLQASAGHTTWTMGDLRAWLRQPGMENWQTAAGKLQIPFVANQNNYAAVYRKLLRPKRVPSWIDAHGAAFSPTPFGGAFPTGGATGAGTEEDPLSANSLFDNLKAKTVHVIRIRPEGDGRSYALFLDYAMKKAADLRRDKPATTPPIFHLIDEAADIFLSPVQSIRRAMESTVHEQVRKGRSLSIGFLLSAQSAGDIPERIRHNMNSMLIFKHRQPHILREILPEMSEAAKAMAAHLQPGEALVELFKVHGLMRCKMERSPAKLHKPGVKPPVAPISLGSRRRKPTP